MLLVHRKHAVVSRWDASHPPGQSVARPRPWRYTGFSTPPGRGSREQKGTPMTQPIQRAAFTIVELLVVVAIIVVLLAMLSPALSTAMYQAELARCAANQRTVANAAIIYALDNKRYYPDRGNMRGTGELRAYLPPIAITNGRANYDLRPMIRKMGLSVNKNLQCALVEAMDLEDLWPNEWAAGNQALWFGWHYTNGGDPTLTGFAGSKALAGMFRLGDRFEAHELRSGGKVKRYNLLVCDWDLYRPWDSPGPNAQSAHPDRTIMWNFQARRVQVFDSLLTLSYWQTPQPSTLPGIRGKLDNNFAYDDASVRRITDIELVDDRMDQIPNSQSEDENGGRADTGRGHGYQVPRN